MVDMDMFWKIRYYKKCTLFCKLSFKQGRKRKKGIKAIRGELLERERDSFWILYTGYLLSIIKITREREKKRERERER